MDRSLELSANQQRNDVASMPRSLALGGSRDVEGVERDYMASSNRATTARTYREMTANDSSRVHAGDVYNYNWSSASANTEPNIDSPEDKLKRLREALSYPQMGLRSAIVEDAYSDTCQWLFNTPQYQRWRDLTLYSKHHGFLWIKGKPGSGKSTAMKTLLSSAESSRDMRGEKVLSYFFNARGEALERSTEGLYRSLLHQITAGVASLPENVMSWMNPGSLDLFHRNGWQVDLLKGLLRKIVLLDRKTHLLCFIDALDEGDNEHSVRDMIEFLEDLTEIARNQHLHFSVCLASRHYPNISIKRLEELQFDDHQGHLQDIDTYVRSKTEVFSARISDELIASIKRRSSGVFLWIVLVIAELKRQADYGNDQKLQALLESIPISVERLLDDTLKKAGQDKSFVATLQWALFSIKPLRSQEFHTAVMLSNGELNSGAIRWDSNISETSTTKVIIFASKGLLEIVASDRIQFIHESVREHFLCTGLERIDRSLIANAVGISHHRLALWCRKYLQLTKVAQAIRSSVDHYRCWHRARKAFPLLQYAMDSMLRHAENAAGHGIQLQAFDETFSFEDFLLLEKSRPIKDAAENTYNNSPPPTALHILIYEQCNHLAETELPKCLVSPTNRYLVHLIRGLPRNAFNGVEQIEQPTRRWQSWERCASSSNCIGGPLHMATRRGAVNVVLALINGGVCVNEHCHTLGSPLLVALRGCYKNQPRVIEALLKGGADPNQRDAQWITPLQIVIGGGDPNTLRILLEWGADPNTAFAACSMGCNPLILATKLCIRRLSRSRSPDDQDDSSMKTYRSTFATVQDHSQVVPSPYSSNVLEILLEHHAAADASCKRCGMTALDAAMVVQNGRIESVLREHGAIRHSVAEWGR